MQGLHDSFLTSDSSGRMNKDAPFRNRLVIISICIDCWCGWAQVSCVSSAGAVAVFLLIFAFCKYKKLF